MEKLNDIIQRIMCAQHKRILILGCPGSGKTTLSYEIIKLIDLPLYHMDELYWLAKWQRPDEIKFLQKLQAITQATEWIIEGNYIRYLKQRIVHADAAILLQTSTAHCLWRVMLRFFKRKEWTSFNPIVALRLIHNICTFRQKTLPQIFQLCKEVNLPLYTLSIKGIFT